MARILVTMSGFHGCANHSNRDVNGFVNRPARRHYPSPSPSPPRHRRGGNLMSCAACFRSLKIVKLLTARSLFNEAGREKTRGNNAEGKRSGKNSHHVDGGGRRRRDEAAGRATETQSNAATAAMIIPIVGRAEQGMSSQGRRDEGTGAKKGKERGGGERRRNNGRRGISSAPRS